MPSISWRSLPTANHPTTISALQIRRAVASDLAALRAIYNEGIEDRVATLDASPKSADDIADWWEQHEGFPVVAAIEAGTLVGWASLNRFSGRCAHADIADLSVYVARSHRGRGVGTVLLRALEANAVSAGFHKIVLHALDANEWGKRLYRKAGFTEVGIFREHGVIDGRRVDVVAMEKIIRNAP
jgi:L-amino acid N-acyltransferase YncA